MQVAKSSLYQYFNTDLALLHPQPYLWCLCWAEHELTFPCIHLSQSQVAGFSILLQPLLFALLHIPIRCRVMICSGVMTVTVAVALRGREKTDVMINKSHKGQLEYNKFSLKDTRKVRTVTFEWTVSIFSTTPHSKLHFSLPGLAHLQLFIELFGPHGLKQSNHKVEQMACNYHPTFPTAAFLWMKSTEMLNLCLQLVISVKQVSGFHWQCYIWIKVTTRSLLMLWKTAKTATYTHA